MFKHEGLSSGLLRYWPWLFVTIGLVAILVVLAALFPQAQLGKEGGILELLSLGGWAAALLIALWTLLANPQPSHKLAAVWTSLVALLAFLRELDLHERLNPEALGSIGVRYRIDWWLDDGVSLWLKLGWVAVLLALVLPLVYAPWALRGSILRRIREGDAMIALFVLAGGLSAAGFVFDDLLRKVTFVSLPIRQAAEESFEMLGAVAFLASAMLRSPFPALAVWKNVREALPGARWLTG